MTPLAERLARRIAATGPIPLADYMAECLLDPLNGYYATRDPLGSAGDFITAPEISQMFGECLGLALAQAWLDQGAPAPVVLAELGPGRGTLMADVLRAARAVPAFRAALSVHLVEASPVLRARQRAALSGVDVTWHDGVDTLPPGPLFLLANEFFDALPIRQFVRDGDGWRERMVGLAAADTLTLGLSPPAPVAALGHRLADTAPGDIVEICPQAAPIMAVIGGRIAAHGGAALIVDYGGWRSRGDTFQAMRGHAFADPLAEPGLADLTAPVDFEALAQAAAPALAAPLATQGAFLERLGITARAQRLARGMRDPALQAHIAAHRRLTHPDEMGTVFKVLGLHPAGHPAPPGFA